MALGVFAAGCPLTTPSKVFCSTKPKKKFDTNRASHKKSKIFSGRTERKLELFFLFQIQIRFKWINSRSVLWQSWASPSVLIIDLEIFYCLNVSNRELQMLPSNLVGRLVQIVFYCIALSEWQLNWNYANLLRKVFCLVWLFNLAHTLS